MLLKIFKAKMNNDKNVKNQIEEVNPDFKL